MLLNFSYLYFSSSSSSNCSKCGVVPLRALWNIGLKAENLLIAIKQMLFFGILKTKKKFKAFLNSYVLHAEQASSTLFYV